MVRWVVLWRGSLVRWEGYGVRCAAWLFSSGLVFYTEDLVSVPNPRDKGRLRGFGLVCIAAMCPLYGRFCLTI